MDKLSISEFVRYTLAAGIASIAFTFAYPTIATSNWQGITATEGAVLGLVLFIMGATLYGFHRALLHPIILRLILIVMNAVMSRVTINGLRNPLKPTSVELDLIRAREDKKPAWSDLWASRTHSLYCSAWGIAAVSLWAPCFVGKPAHPAWLAGLFWTALAAALAEDVRLNYSVIVVEIGG